KVTAPNSWPHNRFGPGVVRVVKAITPTVADWAGDDKEFAARVMRDGRVWRRVAGGIETGCTEDFRRQENQRKPGGRIFDDPRTAFRKTIQRGSDPLPSRTPQ